MPKQQRMETVETKKTVDMKPLMMLAPSFFFEFGVTNTHAIPNTQAICDMLSFLQCVGVCLSLFFCVFLSGWRTQPSRKVSTNTHNRWTAKLFLMGSVLSSAFHWNQLNQRNSKQGLNSWTSTEHWTLWLSFLWIKKTNPASKTNFRSSQWLIKMSSLYE